MKRYSYLKRGCALTLACLLTLGPLTPALAAGTGEGTCDETYYATLDYYGGLDEGSVVKSYHLNSQRRITDYGKYDAVENLTDSTQPTLGEGQVVFTLGEDAPDKFYFEGKTAQPYEDLPWTVSLSYKLNGVPTPAEKLAYIGCGPQPRRPGLCPGQPGAYRRHRLQ